MFYNPKFGVPKSRFGTITRCDGPKVEFYRKQTREPFKPYACYEDALNSHWSGLLRWWDEDGYMYESHHVSTSYYRPCHGVQVLGGINWDTWYACDRDELLEHLKTKYDTISDDVEPRYDQDLGVWSIQIHYDGRCR